MPLISLRRRPPPGTRRDELAELRARFRDAPRPRRAVNDEVALARALRDARRRMSELLDGVTSCTGCARGCARPPGRWDGGACCGGDTPTVFTDDEIAALRLGGTRWRDLAPPTGDHAGCAFRGQTGCSLAPEDRPTVCARYACTSLRRELHAAGRLDAVEQLEQELRETFDALAELRQARAREAEVDAFADALIRAAASRGRARSASAAGDGV